MHIALEGLCLGARNTGIGVCTANLLAGLKQLECPEQFTIYTSNFEGAQEIERPESACVVTVAHSANSRLLRAAWRRLCLNRKLRRTGVDVLHGTAYVLPKRCPGVAAVVTVHDVIALTHPEFCPTLNSWHFRRQLPRTVKVADRIIVHSKATADELVSILGVGTSKIAVLRPGIADRFFKEVSQEERESVSLRYRLPERYVLFAGNLEPKKDLETLLAALERLSETEYPGKLVLTGPQGWKNRALTDKLRGMANRVQVTGYVRTEDMPAVYAGADAAVLVSQVEGFGLPVVEAMAAGTPVIASDIPGLKEASGEAALKVKPGDVQGLVDGLKRVLGDNGLRTELITRGRKHAQEFRSIDYARQHLEIYRGLR